LKEQNKARGLEFAAQTDFSSLPKNGSEHVQLKITSNNNLESDLANFIIEVREGNKLHSSKGNATFEEIADSLSEKG